MNQRRLASFGAAASLIALIAAGCGGSNDSGFGDGSGNGGNGGNGGGGGGTEEHGSSGGGFGHGGPTSGDGGGGGGGGQPDPHCAAAGAEGKLTGVNLVFMFDRSASMGWTQTEPQRDIRDIKWRPVVAATRSFFGDAASSGMNASLAFFSEKSGDRGLCGTIWDPQTGEVIASAEECCATETYSTPAVSLRKLPNATDFAGALDATSPDGSTPTHAALLGAIEQAKAIASDSGHANETTLIVLVTDGIPSDACTPQSTVENTAAVAQEARRAGIKTYVIGVQSTDTPSLDSLNQIANSGGTGKAIMVDVDNPENTKRSFGAALAKIRGQSISCSVAIPPPPPGKTFDLKAVNVVITSNAGAQTLTYNDTCNGGEGWHYDNTSNPKIIELCPSTCGALKSTAGAHIDVQFGCATKGEVIIH
ncbi:VWA domain-containing protein [Pendulispora brunnea]|uniref:VWA domain-containing protein n=1 Tax=Pendulispora brunnea TaxID=2905690 RepID=A0ABZ2K1P7_9BACT